MSTTRCYYCMQCMKIRRNVIPGVRLSEKEQKRISSGCCMVSYKYFSDLIKIFQFHFKKAITVSFASSSKWPQYTFRIFFSKNEIFRIKEFFLRSNIAKNPDFSVMKKIREFFWGLWTQFFFFFFSESPMGVDYNFPFLVFSWISSFPRKFHSQNMLNVNHVSKNKIYMMCGLQMVSNYTNLH